jgi:predicted GIY-YIG superfamily endonuclease
MLLRDRLRARMAEMGKRPDYQRLAREVLGIANAPAELARRLVSQALVVEDRQEAWQRTGERIVPQAPAAPGVYVLRDAEGRALYVGKANNVRRRLGTHFSGRRWRGLKAEFARATGAEWQETGSELEALLREASLIADLSPAVNVQTSLPVAGTRAVPRSLLKDVIVLLRSVEHDSAEIVGARPDGGWMIQRTRRDGSDLAVHTTRLTRFFNSSLRPGGDPRPFAPIVYSWLAGRGRDATRIDPHAVSSPRDLRARLRAALADADLFVERIVVVSTSSARR